MKSLSKELMALTLLSLPLAGCGSTSVALREVRTIKAAQGGAQTQAYLIQTDSHVRNSYVFVRKPDANVPTQTITCNEPMPDTALQTAQKLAASVEETSGNKSQVGWETSSTIAQLAGRTQTVLIARELLFNSCLMYANGGITNPQLLAIYKDTVDLVRDLAAADKLNAESAASDASARAKVAVRALDPLYSLAGIGTLSDLAGAILRGDATTRDADITNGADCGTDSYCKGVLAKVIDAAKSGDRDDLTRKLSLFDSATVAKLRVKYNSL